MVPYSEPHTAEDFTPAVAGQWRAADACYDERLLGDDELQPGRQRDRFELDEGVARRTGNEGELDRPGVRRSRGDRLDDCLALGELGFACFDGTLASLDRGSLEFDRAQLLTPAAELFLRLGDELLALGQLAEIPRELGFAGLEVGRADAQHALDRRS